MQVLDSGLRPNTTTFNALIAAYSKAGNIDKVREKAGAIAFVAHLPTCLQLHSALAAAQLWLVMGITKAQQSFAGRLVSHADCSVATR